MTSQRPATDDLARAPTIDADERASLAPGGEAAQAQLVVADRMVSLGLLAAGVAHEINNPLAALLANLEVATQHVDELLVRDGPEGPAAELRAELRDARAAAERVLRTVRDLRVFARADDEGALGQDLTDVNRVVESSLRMANPQLRLRARIVRRLGDVPRVRANEWRLGQVFLNLLINAAQAIPEGRADANEVRVATSLDGRGRVVVEVADTGSGIPSDALARIFTPFYTTKPPGVGTGLGLSICERIVAAIGGEIAVESEVGRGTTFRVALPAEPRESVQPPAPAAPSPPPAQATRRGRVLVVDDEVVVATAIRRVLSREHDVEVATDARDALARIDAGARYDVIVCDLMMPVLTGMDFHAALLRSDPAIAARVVFMTGGAVTPHAQEFLAHVPNAWLEKPFDTAALRALVAARVA